MSSNPITEVQKQPNNLVKAGDVMTPDSTNVDQTPVTDFHDTAAVTKTCQKIGKDYMRTIDRNEIMDFKKWFEIPYQIASFNWTDTSSTFLTEISMPDALFKLPLFFNKLKSFRYVKANFEISFKLNGTAMQYGKLMIAAVPYPQFMLIDDGALSYSKFASKWSLSSFPHVQDRKSVV